MIDTLAPNGTCVGDNSHPCRKSLTYRLGWWLLVAIIAVWATSASGEDGDGLQPVARDVLALYDSNSEPEPRLTRLHRFVELPLNYLGYRVTYWDIAAGMPDIQTTDAVKAVFMWFDRPTTSQGFADWCAGIRTSGGHDLKWVVFGDPGIALDGPPTVARDACLATAGLQLGRREVRLGTLAKAAVIDPLMVRDPGDVLPLIGIHPELQAAPGRRSHLSVIPAPSDPGHVDLVVTGPASGYVSSDAALIVDPRLPGPVWRIDILAFLETVLGSTSTPVPDVTTAFGRRLFFVTVGPEGWLTPLPAGRYGETPLLASQTLVSLFRDEFPDLPVSVAVVSGDLDAANAGRAAESGKAAAAALFAVPTVEIASAGASGVRTWQFFEHFDRSREATAILAARRAAKDDTRGLLSSAVDTLSNVLVSERTRSSGADATLPRRYSARPFSPQAEIGAGLAAAGALAPPGRQAALFLWRGDAMPFPDALAAAKVPALGGGGGTVTLDAPGLAGLWPFSAPVGTHRQIYDALSGPSSLASDAADPGLAVRTLNRTVHATETPIRLKPYQIALTAGDMVPLATRLAVRRALEGAREMDVLPIAASRYARIVAGFQTARVVPIGDLQWRIEDRGDLAALRLDDAAGLAVDLDASPGVIGARRKEESLYVALDPAVASPILTVIRSDVPTGMVSQGAPAIESARWWIHDQRRDGCSLRFTASGHGPGEFIVATRPGTQLTIEARSLGGRGTPVLDTFAVAGPDGRAHFSVGPLAPGDQAEIAVVAECGT